MLVLPASIICLAINALVVEQDEELSELEIIGSFEQCMRITSALHPGVENAKGSKGVFSPTV